MRSNSLISIFLLTVHFRMIACTPILNQTSDDPLIPLVDNYEARVDEGVKLSMEEPGYHGLTLITYRFWYDDDPQKRPPATPLDSYNRAEVHFEELPRTPLWGGLVNYWSHDRWSGLTGELPGRFEAKTYQPIPYPPALSAEDAYQVLLDSSFNKSLDFWELILVNEPSWGHPRTDQPYYYFYHCIYTPSVSCEAFMVGMDKSSFQLSMGNAIPPADAMNNVTVNSSISGGNSKDLE